MPATPSREFEEQFGVPLYGYGITERPYRYDAAAAPQAREAASPGIQELHNESEWRSLCRFDQSVEDLLIKLFRHRSHSFVAMRAIDQQAEQFRTTIVPAYPSVAYACRSQQGTLAATVVRRLEAGVTICGQRSGGP